VEGAKGEYFILGFDGQGISRKMKSHPATIFENPEKSFVLHSAQ
jgi:hypothetical protein